MYLKNTIILICISFIFGGCVPQDIIPNNSKKTTTLSDVAIERKKYEIDNISIAKGLFFPTEIDLGNNIKAKLTSQFFAGEKVKNYSEVHTRIDAMTPWIKRSYIFEKNTTFLISFFGSYYFDHKKLGRGSSEVKIESFKQFIELHKSNKAGPYGSKIMSCSELENQLYKNQKGNVNGVCIYEEKSLDANTHKIVYIFPHVFAKDGSWSSPMELEADILHKNSKGYFTYSYKKIFDSSYIKKGGDAFQEIKDIFEKKIPQTMDEVVSNLDSLKEMEWGEN